MKEIADRITDWFVLTQMYVSFSLKMFIKIYVFMKHYACDCNYIRTIFAKVKVTRSLALGSFERASLVNINSLFHVV